MPSALHRKATYHPARDGLEAENSTLRPPDNFLSALDLGAEALRPPQGWEGCAELLSQTAVRKTLSVERLPVCAHGPGPVCEPCAAWGAGAGSREALEDRRPRPGQESALVFL